MKSICIKTNNSKYLDYLINKYDIDNSEIKIKKFKIYYNLIIHYLGDEEKKFLYSISMFLSDFIIDAFEDKLIKRCINKNYFYFDEFEKNIIFKISKKILEIQEIEFDYKKEILTEILYDYILNNKNFYIEGVVNFRIKEYIEILDYLVELSIMNYLKYI